MKKLILLFTVACISLSSFALTTIYVKPTGSSSTSVDGLSWVNAVSLSRARSLVNYYNTLPTPVVNQVWMAAGTYDLTAAFQTTIPITIYGGFAGTETNLIDRNWKNNQTILNQTAATQVIWGNASVDVLLDGLILQGGNPATNGGCGSLASGTTLRNCIIRNNKVGASQSSVFLTMVPLGSTKLITIDNCLIVNNQTAVSPCVISIVAGAQVNITNTTIANNLCDASGAGTVIAHTDGTSSLNLKNSIIYNNKTASATATSVSATVMSSGAKILSNNAWDVAATNATATANILLSSSPFVSATSFVGAANGTTQLLTDINAADFKLATASTCINAGNSSYVTESFDLSGTTRIVGSAVDMGAYELAAPSAPTITSITPGDLQLTVEFTAGSDGGSSITNYKYSTDGGSTFTACSPAQTTSPIVITGLTNDVSYAVQIKAVSAIGDGTATASTSATPSVATALASLKTEANVKVVNGQLVVTGADTYSVYSTQGQALTKAISSENYMALQTGIYLVKVGSKMHKIIVR